MAGSLGEVKESRLRCLNNSPQRALTFWRCSLRDAVRVAGMTQFLVTSAQANPCSCLWSCFLGVLLTPSLLPEVYLDSSFSFCSQVTRRTGQEIWMDVAERLLKRFFHFPLTHTRNGSSLPTELGRVCENCTSTLSTETSSNDKFLSTLPSPSSFLLHSAY